MTGNGRTVTLSVVGSFWNASGLLEQAVQKTRPAAVLLVVSSVASAGRSASSVFTQRTLSGI